MCRAADSALACNRGVCFLLCSTRALADKDKHEFQKWAITLIPDAQPWNGGRKGADTGIDGIVYLRTGKDKGQRAII